MYLSDFSLFRILPLLVLSAGAIALIALADLRMAKRYAQQGIRLLGETIFLALLCWAIVHFNHWAATIGIIALQSVIMTHLYSRQHGRRGWVVCAASLVAAGLTATAFWFAMKPMPAQQALAPVIILLLAYLSYITGYALQCYDHTVKATQSHRVYLLANGATRFEAFFPAIRRAFRGALLLLLRHPLRSFMPALPFVLLLFVLNGFSAASAFVATLLLALAALTASVVSITLTLWVELRFFTV